MSEQFSINDKAELEMARLSLRTHLNLALPIVLERTRPFFRAITKHRVEQRWAMIEKLIDQQIDRIDRDAAAEFRTHGPDSAVDDEIELPRAVRRQLAHLQPAAGKARHG